MMRKTSVALAATLVGAALVGGGHVANAEPLRTVPAIPEEYRAVLPAAAKTCPQVDAPLLAAYLADASAFKAEEVSAAGAISAGQLMPQMWAKYARPGEVPTDPVASTNVSARFLCATAEQVDKAAPAISDPDVKTTFALIIVNMGDAVLPELVDKSAFTNPDRTAALKESVPYAGRVLTLRNEYRKQGL